MPPGPQPHPALLLCWKAIRADEEHCKGEATAGVSPSLLSRRGCSRNVQCDDRLSSVQWVLLSTSCIPGPLSGPWELGVNPASTSFCCVLTCTCRWTDKVESDYEAATSTWEDQVLNGAKASMMEGGRERGPFGKMTTAF